MKRLSTGIRDLDLILGGGLPRNSINIITGPPGSGKTILAEELAFANAAADRPVLYLTTLSEPLSKILAYLQEYSFADTSRVGEEILYESIGDALRDGGVDLQGRVLAAIKEHRPRLLIIDSFKAIADLMPKRQLWREQVFELAGLLSAYDTTTIWVGEYGEDMMDRVEFSVADGILELSRREFGSRDDRYLRVIKMRGSSFRDGLHTFQITSRGLVVYPRLVSQPSVREMPPMRPIATGIVGLDALIEGGWPRGTSSMVAGPSGAGKTMLGLHFLRRGVEEGETGLLVSMQEPPAQLRQAMVSLGWNADELIGAGKLDILYRSPVELQIDTIIKEMFHRIDRDGVARLVIDGLGDFEDNARDPKRFTDFVYTLAANLAGRGVTAFFNQELINLPPGEGTLGWPIGHTSDNILLLSLNLDDELTRTIRVVKARGRAHEGRKRELRIRRGGMFVE